EPRREYQRHPISRSHLRLAKQKQADGVGSLEEVLIAQNLLHLAAIIQSDVSALIGILRRLIEQTGDDRRLFLFYRQRRLGRLVDGTAREAALDETPSIIDATLHQLEGQQAPGIIRRPPALERLQPRVVSLRHVVGGDMGKI